MRNALRLRCEALEPRQLLSGVTLITHGLAGNVDGWVTKMADAIAGRLDVSIDQPRYRVDVTDPGHDGGPLSVVNTSRSGPSIANSANPEIVILLNWADVAGTLSFGGGYHRSTVDVAAAVVDKLLSANFLSDFAAPLAELPFHLIGHSRGASLVGELAKKLGEHGVWVDQVTTLDPHPVDGVREPTIANYNFGDAPMTSWENVTYWDNYWRTEGSASLDFTGESVANVYNLQLTESVLDNGGSSYEHSDVHTWYHGTVDTSPAANDGDYTVPAGWYGGPHPARTATGYLYSRIVNGARLAAGVSANLGGSANRSAVSWTAADWANLLELKVTGGSSQFVVGASVPVSYYYQDVASGATVSLRLDPDRNPYNANGLSASQLIVGQTNATPVLVNSVLPTSGAGAGAYYVAAQITDAGGHTRYAYAYQPILLTPPPTLSVVNTLDSGTGSLRQAILDANALGVASTIAFNLPPGASTIQPGSQLPNLTNPVSFDVPANVSVTIGTGSGFTLGDYSALTKIDGGALAIGGSQSHAGAVNLNANAGTLALNSDGGTNLTLSANAPVVLNAMQHLYSLNVASGVTVSLAGGGAKTLWTNTLAIAGTGQLDLTDNDLVVQAMAGTKAAVLADATAKLASGYGPAAPHWLGAGITSSTAAADATHRTALGVLLNENALGGSIYADFSGQSVNNNSVLVKFTYYGDANLSGVVDGTDYALVDNGFNFGLAGWINGNFNYDGTIDGTDYALIDSAFNFQGGPLATPSAADAALRGLSGNESTGSEQPSRAAASVPDDGPPEGRTDFPVLPAQETQQELHSSRRAIFRQNSDLPNGTDDDEVFDLLARHRTAARLIG